MRAFLAVATVILATGCDRADPRVAASPPYALAAEPEAWSATTEAPVFSQALHFLRDRRATVERYHQFYLSAATGGRGVAAGAAGGAALNAVFGGGVGWTTGLLAAAGTVLAADTLTANSDTRAAYAAAVRGLDCLEIAALEGRRALAPSNPAVQFSDRTMEELQGALQAPAVAGVSENLRIRAQGALAGLRQARNTVTSQTVFEDPDLAVLITRNTTRILREMNARIEGLMPDIRQVIAVAGGIPSLAQPGSATAAPPAPPVAPGVLGAVGNTPPGPVARSEPAESLNDKTSRAFTAAEELDRRRNERRTAIRNEMASCGAAALPTPAPLTLLENYTQEVQAGSSLTLNVQGGSGFYMIQQTGEIIVALTAEPYVGPGPFRIRIPSTPATVRGRTYTYAITDVRNPALPSLPLTIKVAK